ncbi:MAG TPA: hypothetical protein VGH60_06095 [Solirubrobacteraceae bacterium]
MWEIIELLRSYDGDEESLRANHSLVKNEHLRVAKAYVERFPTEIEVFIKKNHPPLDELRGRLAIITTTSPTTRDESLAMEGAHAIAEPPADVPPRSLA